MCRRQDNASGTSGSIIRGRDKEGRDHCPTERHQEGTSWSTPTPDLIRSSCSCFLRLDLEAQREPSPERHDPRTGFRTSEGEDAVGANDERSSRENGSELRDERQSSLRKKLLPDLDWKSRSQQRRHFALENNGVRFSSRT